METINEISPGKNAPEIINTVVTIPQGSKLEFTLEGTLKLKDFLPVPFMVEGDYGVIPQTKCADGKPLGAVILGPSCPPGCMLECRPIGVLKLGLKRAFVDRILAVPVKDPRYKAITELEDLPDHIPLEIANHFKQYSNASIRGWKGSEASKKVIMHSIELYRKRG